MIITLTPRRLFILGLALGLAAWLLWPAAAPLWPVAKLAQPPSRLIVIGDSLSTGFRLNDPQQSFPLQLGRLLDLPVQVEGVNGSTLAEGAKRLDSLKLGDATLVLVCLGGNDQLRQLPIEGSNAALTSILQRLRAQGHAVAFVEVIGPFGGERSKAWRAICKAQQVALIADAMDGILSNEKLKIDSMDIHPNEAGCALLAARSLKELRRFGLIAEEP